MKKILTISINSTDLKPCNFNDFSMISRISGSENPAWECFFSNPLSSTENPRQTIRFMSHSRGNCSRTIRRYLNVPPSEIFLHFRSQPRLSLLPLLPAKPPHPLKCQRDPRTPYNAEKGATGAPPGGLCGRTSDFRKMHAPHLYLLL